MRLTSLFAILLLTAGLLSGCDLFGGSDDSKDTTSQPGEDTSAPGEDTSAPGEDTTGQDCTAVCAAAAYECGVNEGCDCGQCENGVPCIGGKCQTDCTPDCTGKVCGDDGCEGSCGNCQPGYQCAAGQCVEQCEPDCTGKVCGDDGCNGSCGNCPAPGGDPSATECDNGQCVAPQGLTCMGIFDCQGECGQDMGCAQACIGQGSMDAQTAYNGIVGCIQQNGQHCAQGDNACISQVIEDSCWTEYQECFHGDLTCQQINDCMMACPPNDQYCPSNCFAEGSVEAQDQFQAIIDCIIEQCGEEPTQDCANSAQNGVCAPIVAECFNQAKPAAIGGGSGSPSEDFVNLKNFMQNWKSMY